MSPEKSKVRCRAPLLRTRGGPGRPSASLPCRSALSPGVAVGTLEGRAPPWSGGGGGPLTKGTRAQLPELLPGLLLRMSPAPLSPVPKTHTLRRRRPRQPPLPSATVKLLPGGQAPASQAGGLPQLPAISGAPPQRCVLAQGVATGPRAAGEHVLPAWPPAACHRENSALTTECPPVSELNGPQEAGR